MREVICSGGLFLSMSSKRFLFLHRTQGKTADTWGLVGGKKEPVDDAPYNTLIREITEELGGVPQVKKVIPLEFFSSTDQLFQYNTYIILHLKMIVLNVKSETYAIFIYYYNKNKIK